MVFIATLYSYFNIASLFPWKRYNYQILLFLSDMQQSYISSKSKIPIKVVS